MEIRGSDPSFPPVYSSASRALILGSYPSPQSFAYGFYYGHPQNRFWPLLAQLTGYATPQSIFEKKSLVLENSLALWDSLEQCSISGASDASIRNPVPNDIPALLAKTSIQAVFCNGAAAHKYYRLYCLPHTSIESICLPSTSPANAAYSMQRLLDAWQPLCCCL